MAEIFTGNVEIQDSKAANTTIRVNGESANVAVNNIHGTAVAELNAGGANKRGGLILRNTIARGTVGSGGTGLSDPPRGRA